MRPFLSGAAYPFRAVRLLVLAPGLWRYIVVPMALTLLIATAIYTVTLVAALRVIDRFAGDASGLAAVAVLVLQIAVVIVLLVVAGFVVVRIAVVVGAPWHSRLSERIEVMLTGASPPAAALTPMAAARDLGRAVGYEARKLALIGSVALPLLIVNLLPVLGQVAATVGGLALAATIAGLDFLDHPLERRRRTFRQKLRFIRRTLPASAGFGLACVALVSVPLLNLLTIPLCIAAGTLFFAEHAAADTPR